MAPRPAETAFCLSLAAHATLLAVGLFIDGRYLRPFALPLYVTQAAGLARLLERMAGGSADVTPAPWAGP